MEHQADTLELAEAAKATREGSKAHRDQLETDFGVKDPQDLDDDPIQPHRKRILFLACACILGEPAKRSALYQHHVVVVPFFLPQDYRVTCNVCANDRRK